MAIQLYAAPIFIEAFQTGKAAIYAEYLIRMPRELVLNPDNCLVKGLKVLIGSLSAHRLFFREFRRKAAEYRGMAADECVMHFIRERALERGRIEVILSGRHSLPCDTRTTLPD
jgi:hypothetical protein